MPQLDMAAARQKLTELATNTPGLRLLVLYGSRARGDIHPGSDWDLGYLAAEGFDPDAFLAKVVLGLDDDRVDLVDLGRPPRFPLRAQPSSLSPPAPTRSRIFA